MRAVRLRRRALPAAIALVLALCAAASASAATFGADLSAPADNTATCGQVFFGAGSCVFFSGAPGPSFYAPASGTVTAVRVKTANVPQAPMQIVVLRSLYQNKAGDPGHPYFACCFVERYGPTFTPGAGTVTTVPASLPMVEDPTPPPDDTTTNARGDFLALSVLAPNVPIPLTSAGSGSYVGSAPAPDPGSTPAPSPNPYSGQVSTSGFGGHLLVNADIDTDAGALPGGGGGGGTVPGAPLTLPARGQLRGNTAALPLACILTTACDGVLRLTDRAPAATAARKKAKPRALGSARFSIPAGKTATVKVKLNRAGRKLARRHKTLRVVATAKAGGQTVTKRLKLKRKN
jgi:hypothetical protein